MADPDDVRRSTRSEDSLGEIIEDPAFFRTQEASAASAAVPGPWRFLAAAATAFSRCDSRESTLNGENFFGTILDDATEDAAEDATTEYPTEDVVRPEVFLLDGDVEAGLASSPSLGRWDLRRPGCSGLLGSVTFLGEVSLLEVGGEVSAEVTAVEVDDRRQSSIIIVVVVAGEAEPLQSLPSLDTLFSSGRGRFRQCLRTTNSFGYR